MYLEYARERVLIHLTGEAVTRAENASSLPFIRILLRHASGVSHATSVIHFWSKSLSLLAEVLREIDEPPLHPRLFVAPLQYLLVGHAADGPAVANPQGLREEVQLSKYSSNVRLINLSL